MSYKHAINKKHVPNLSYVLADKNIEFPIIDITHPLFLSSIDEKLYHLSNIKSEKTVKLLKRLPRFFKTLFTNASDVENSYLTGMRTMVYKLGPNLVKGIKLGFRDKWSVNQDNFMGLRIRLRDICKLQADSLIPQLKENTGKDLCFFNIAGGPSSDSINTIFLIQQIEPELLRNRKIEIDILDIDTFGPNFAKRCIDELKIPGNRFDELDITVKVVPYDWSKPEELAVIMKEKEGWIQICTSEGGLFEYGTEKDIIQNLNQLYMNSSENMKIAGSLIFNKTEVSPGYLGFAELTGIQVKFVGVDGLNAILQKTDWVIDQIRTIDNVFIVFTLQKAKHWSNMR